jgi:hypothetical protein
VFKAVVIAPSDAHGAWRFDSRRVRSSGGSCSRRWTRPSVRARTMIAMASKVAASVGGCPWPPQHRIINVEDGEL